MKPETYEKLYNFLIWALFCVFVIPFIIALFGYPTYLNQVSQPLNLDDFLFRYYWSYILNFIPAGFLLIITSLVVFIPNFNIGQKIYFKWTSFVKMETRYKIWKASKKGPLILAFLLLPLLYNELPFKNYLYLVWNVFFIFNFFCFNYIVNYRELSYIYLDDYLKNRQLELLRKSMMALNHCLDDKISNDYIYSVTHYIHIKSEVQKDQTTIRILQELLDQLKSDDYDQSIVTQHLHNIYSICIDNELQEIYSEPYFPIRYKIQRSLPNFSIEILKPFLVAVFLATLAYILKFVNINITF